MAVMTAPATIDPPDFDALDAAALAPMRAAAETVMDVMEELAQAGRTVVSELLETAGDFVEWDHYPKGDIYDPATHSRYFYHAHERPEGEHGHFHLFRQQKTVPGVAPAQDFDRSSWPKPEDDDDPVIHLIAISIDPAGAPRRLFTVNRWVTDEFFYWGEAVTPLLHGFRFADDAPFAATTRWVEAMAALYRPQIAQLIAARDRVLKTRLAAPDGAQALEDRELDVISECPISLLDQLRGLGMVED